MDAVIFSISFACASAAVLLLAMPFDKRMLGAGVLACALYLGMDDFVTGVPAMVEGFDILGGNWNWMGKLCSLGLSVLAIGAFRLSPAAVGLTLEHRHAATGLIALAFFIGWGAALGLAFRPGSPDAETLAFQALMPGLSEEIVYRGIVPALLLGLMRRSGAVEGMPWAVILASAGIFGIWHGLSYSQGAFAFELMSASFPFIGSIAGGWLRFKTGSLLFPVLAHSLANLAFHVAGS